MNENSRGNGLVFNLSTIKELASQSNDIFYKGIVMLVPEVDEIIQNKIIDDQLIEHFLDQLLTFAGCKDGLVLFKKLLKYYYPINPHSVAYYVKSYREMFEENYFGEVKENNC